MYALHVITLTHYHLVTMGMTLFPLPNSVTNIADVGSAFDKSLPSECIHRNTIDCAP